MDYCYEDLKPHFPEKQGHIVDFMSDKGLNNIYNSKPINKQQLYMFIIKQVGKLGSKPYK